MWAIDLALCRWSIDPVKDARKVDLRKAVRPDDLPKISAKPRGKA